MRRTLRTAAVVAAFAALLPGAASAAGTSGAASPSRSSRAARLLAAAPVARYDAAATTHLYALVNGYRRGAGLPALAVDPRLADVAKAWTLTMATTGDLAHNDALFTKTMHAALGISGFGENVAFDSDGVDDAHQLLLDSPHHRENIDDAAYSVAGFAVVVDAKGITWVTEDFGTVARAAQPAARVAKPAAAVRPATRRPAARPAAAAPRATPAARPAAKPTTRPGPARPAYVPPAAPRRPSPTDRVDLPQELDTVATAATGPAGSGGATVPPLAAVAALLLLVTGGLTARSARLER